MREGEELEDDCGSAAIACGHEDAIDLDRLRHDPLMAAILRPACTPSGTEVCTVIKHVTQRLRRHWPNTRIVWRVDSHYGRVEAMEWAENNDTDYIFLALPAMLCSMPWRQRPLLIYASVMR